MGVKRPEEPEGGDGGAPTEQIGRASQVVVEEVEKLALGALDSGDELLGHTEGGRGAAHALGG